MSLSTSKRNWIIGLLLMCVCLAFGANSGGETAEKANFRNYCVTDFGAVGDGVALDSPAIQKAIDLCSEQGGGTVRVPPGTYRSGTLRMRSGVNLYLDFNATIVGSADRKDYSDTQMSLVMAKDVKNIIISGQGALDGNGAVFGVKESAPGRPMVIWFQTSQNIKVEGITIKNSAAWVQYYKECDGVVLNQITVYSHSNLNNDAIDIDSSNVLVTDSVIDSDDDGICLKSHNRSKVVENIVISNCIISSNCNAIKLGTDSLGGFRNIAISNCVIKPSTSQVRRKWLNAISGIALEAVDGGNIENVTISNIAISDVQTPIFVRLGNRGKLESSAETAVPPVGSIRNVKISGIVARGTSMVPCSITGIPGGRISGITLDNITIGCAGGGKKEFFRMPVPEAEKNYPEATMFGRTLPAYGLYVRHADEVTLNDIRFYLTTSDERPAVYLEDVATVRVRGLEADAPASDLARLHIKDSNRVFIRDSFLFAERKQTVSGENLQQVIVDGEPAR